MKSPPYDLYLPEELILEILYKLPAKTLIQCTTVCKSWHSLINSPNFISTHLERAICTPKTSSNDPLLLIRQFGHGLVPYALRLGTAAEENRRVSFPCSSLSPEAPNFEVIGSCNGLVCFRNVITDAIHLWNPCIKKSFTLPKPGLGFPLPPGGRQFYYFGFGFDSKTNDYKVLEITQVVGRPRWIPEYMVVTRPPVINTYVEIYSLKMGSWKVVDSQLASGYVVDPCNSWSSYASGYLHSLAAPLVDAPVNVIIGLSVNDGALREIMLPQSLQLVDWDLLYIVGYDGGSSIAVVKRIHDRFSGYGRYEVWVMRKYGVAESWFGPLTITEPLNFSKVLEVRRNGEILLAMWGDGFFTFNKNVEVLKHGLQRGLVLYDPKCKQFKYLRAWMKRDYSYEYSYVNSYIESLVLLDIGKNTDDENGAKSDVGQCYWI